MSELIFWAFMWISSGVVGVLLMHLSTILDNNWTLDEFLDYLEVDGDGYYSTLGYLVCFLLGPLFLLLSLADFVFILISKDK